MHRGALLIAAILAAPAIAADVEVSFAPPAQVWGHVAGQNWTWMLIIFAPGDDGVVHIDAPGGGTELNRSYHRRLVESQNGIHDASHSSSTTLPEKQRHWPGSEATLVPAPQAWSSLLIHGEGIQFTSTGSLGELDIAGKGQSMRALSPPGVPWWTHRVGAEVPETALAISQETTTLSTNLTGAFTLEWHQMLTTCPMDCLDSGALARTAHAGPFSEVWSEIRSYISLSAQDGGLEIVGNVSAVIAGGKSVDLDLQRLRLAQAALHGDCGACNGTQQTIAANGSIELRNARVDRAYITAALGGDATWLFFDETATDPSNVFPASPVQAALGVGLLAVLAGWLLKARILALFTRLKRDTALAHPRRSAVYEAILQKPGLKVAEIARKADVPRTTAMHHVRRLEEANLVVSRQDGKHRKYFENHGRYDGSWRLVELAMRPEHDLLIQLLALRAMEQAEVHRLALEELGWPRSTTLCRLRQLVAAGLVTHTDRGGRVFHAIDWGSVAKAKEVFDGAGMPSPALVPRIFIGEGRG